MTTFIRTTRTARDGTPQPRRLDRPELDTAVEFDDAGRAEVADDDATHLTDHCSYIEYDDALCQADLDAGGLCGRDRPCQYHDGDATDDDPDDEVES